MILNDAGLMANSWWQKLPSKFPMVALDEFIIMPNHLHGIIQMIENDKVGTGQSACPSVDLKTKKGQAHRLVPTLSDVIHWYKTMTTNAYIQGVKTQNWTRFEGHLWQRSFYDHIIRDDEGLKNIREYIHHNSLKPHKT